MSRAPLDLIEGVESFYPQEDLAAELQEQEELKRQEQEELKRQVEDLQQLEVSNVMKQKLF